MKVLVLGGSGYVGARICALLSGSGWGRPISASSRQQAAGIETLRVDTRNESQLVQALQGVDAVVNCVAGSAEAIAQGARVLVEASRSAGCERIVHLSSMAVYGLQEGQVREEAPTDPSLGWYARAKCEAEAHMASFARDGGSVTMLRPGCVWGPGSELWVGRIARFLQAGRLGDLGAAGDGWSNLVHVDDVAAAVLAGLRMDMPGGEIRCYNLAAPDSPRWNEYFVDLALAIGATPVRRIARGQLRADALLAGPPLKAAQMLAIRAGLAASSVPDPLPPGLLGLWERHLRLDSNSAREELGLRWTSYREALQQSAAWYLRSTNSVVQRRLAQLGNDFPN